MKRSFDTVVDYDVHLVVADVIKSFEYGLVVWGFLAWFRHAYFEYPLSCTASV